MGFLPPQAFRPESDPPREMYQVCLTQIVQLSPVDHHTFSLLGPGAKNILTKLTDKNLPVEERMNIKKTPRSLDIREWAKLVHAFKEWPFRPEVRPLY